MNKDNIDKADELRSFLLSHQELGQYVDRKYKLPESYKGTAMIKLIILGQDTTVKNEQSRKFITTVLNLNKAGKLKAYLSKICNGLGLNLEENIYATNIF